MGEITLTTFLLQEVLWELRALLGVLVPLSGLGVLLGAINGVWWGLVLSLCIADSHHIDKYVLLGIFTYYYLYVHLVRRGQFLFHSLL